MSFRVPSKLKHSMILSFPWVLKIRLFFSTIFCKRYALIWTGISSCGFPLASLIQKVILNNSCGSCCLQSLGFWNLPQNGLDNLLNDFLELETSSSRVSSCTKAGQSVPIFSSLIISDSEVNEFIKRAQKEVAKQLGAWNSPAKLWR